MMHAFITDYLVLVLLFSVHIICSDGSGLEIDSWQVVYRRFFLRNYIAAMRMYPFRTQTVANLQPYCMDRKSAK